MALEASNQEGPVNDPDNPDVDNMTYEQLMEMGENAGKVNKGYSKAIIDSLKPILWREGKTKEEHTEALDATRASAYREIVARLNYLRISRQS